MTKNLFNLNPIRFLMFKKLKITKMGKNKK